MLKVYRKWNVLFWGETPRVENLAVLKKISDEQLSLKLQRAGCLSAGELMQSVSFSSMFLKVKLQPSQSRPGLVTNATSNNNDKFLVASSGVMSIIRHKARRCIRMYIWYVLGGGQQTSVQGDRWRNLGDVMRTGGRSSSSSVASKYVCSW